MEEGVEEIMRRLIKKELEEVMKEIERRDKRAGRERIWRL